MGLRRGDERSERKTGNEYERRYFREDLAAVRVHHDRRSGTKGMSLTPLRENEKGARRGEGKEERRVKRQFLDIIFLSRPQDRLIFYNSVASYTVSTMAVISIY